LTNDFKKGDVNQVPNSAPAVKITWKSSFIFELRISLWEDKVEARWTPFPDPIELQQFHECSCTRKNLCQGSEHLQEKRLLHTDAKLMIPCDPMFLEGRICPSALVRKEDNLGKPRQT